MYGSALFDEQRCVSVAQRVAERAFGWGDACSAEPASDDVVDHFCREWFTTDADEQWVGVADLAEPLKNPKDGGFSRPMSLPCMHVSTRCNIELHIGKKMRIKTNHERCATATGTEPVNGQESREGSPTASQGRRQS